MTTGPPRRRGRPSERSSKLSSPTSTPLEQIEVDRENLYLEEVFTDLKVATIRRLSPVKANGSPDETRPTLFHGGIYYVIEILNGQKHGWALLTKSSFADPAGMRYSKLGF